MKTPIQIFNRHCFFSDVSINKKRPEWFSRENCFLNLLKNLNNERLHIIFDENKGSIDKHFLSMHFECPIPVMDFKIINEGNESGSFLKLLEYILTQDYSDDTIVYIVEDDYLHMPFFNFIIRQGFEIGGDLVSLYDHFDKYTNMYPNLDSRIVLGRNSHWRTSPSTTNTFAVKFKTLKEDIDIYREFSTGTLITKDHERFLALKERKNRNLVTCIPGYSTHVEEPWMSPLVNWQSFNK